MSDSKNDAARTGEKKGGGRRTKKRRTKKRRTKRRLKMNSRIKRKVKRSYRKKRMMSGGAKPSPDITIDPQIYEILEATGLTRFETNLGGISYEDLLDKLPTKEVRPMLMLRGLGGGHAIKFIRGLNEKIKTPLDTTLVKGDTQATKYVSEPSPEIESQGAHVVTSRLPLKYIEDEIVDPMGALFPLDCDEKDGKCTSEKLGVVACHGRQIPGEFTIVPDFMDLYLYVSDGAYLDETADRAIHKNMEYYYRVYKRNSLVHNYYLDFNTIMFPDPTHPYAYGGIFEYEQKTSQENISTDLWSDVTKDESLSKHDESYISKGKLIEKMDAHEELTFRLSDIFKIISEKGQPKPSKWLGHFCRATEEPFDIHELNLCKISGLDKLPDNFFDGKIKTLLWTEPDPFLLTNQSSLSANVRIQYFKNIFEDVLRYNISHGIATNSELNRTIESLGYTNITGWLADISRKIEQFEGLDKLDVCFILLIYNAISE